MEDRKNELKVESPCHMRWSDLKGNSAKRWCDDCALHVVDGSSLTRAEATDLVKSSEGRVCMRIVRDADGRIVHAEQKAPSAVLGRVLRYGLTAAAGVLAACVDEAKESTDAAPPGLSGGEVDPGVPGDPGERPLELLGEVFISEEGLNEELGDVAAPAELVGRVAMPTDDHADTVPETEGSEIMGKVNCTLPPPAPLDTDPDQ